MAGTKIRRRARSTRAGREIIAGLTELAEALERGEPLAERFTVRTVRVAAPGRHAAESIRALRDELNVSQSVFAQMLGVSVKLVQAWEIGSKTPAPWARRLLDVLAADPDGARKAMLEITPAA